MVVITSWAPTVALRIPAIPAHAAPASAAATTANVMWTKLFISENDEPIQIAKYAPMKYWPWPPMLKRPQRKANATASPVRTSVVQRISVC